MTLRFTDAESATLRPQANAEGRSMQDVARAAVREYMERRALRTTVENASDVLTPRYADVLDRLGK